MKRTPEEIRELLEGGQGMRTMSMGAAQKAAGDMPDRCIDFAITTTDVDRYDDIVLSSGCDEANYLNNPVVLAFHNSRSMMPVGKSISLNKEESRIISRCEFGSEETLGEWGKTANSFYLAYVNGFMSAVSIGFIPRDWTWDEKLGGFIINDWELLEYSCVPIPANPFALQQKEVEGFIKELKLEWSRTLDEATPAERESPIIKSIEDAHQEASPVSVPVNSAKDGEPVVLRLTHTPAPIVRITL